MSGQVVAVQAEAAKVEDPLELIGSGSSGEVLGALSISGLEIGCGPHGVHQVVGVVASIQCSH